MSNHVYKVIQVIGTSSESWEDAAKNAIEQAAAHLEDLRVAEVVANDVRVENGKITAYRTRMTLSFRIHEPSELGGK